MRSSRDLTAEEPDGLQTYINKSVFNAVGIDELYLSERDKVPIVSRVRSRLGSSFDPKIALAILKSKLPADAEKSEQIDFAVVETALRGMWELFYPVGVKLSSDEVSEVMAMFDVWSASHGFDKVGWVEFEDLRRWFVDDLCLCIDRVSVHRLPAAFARQKEE